MHTKQIIAVVILFLGLRCARTYGQVVATWTDSSGNWSNSANWSTCPPAACPVVPNNGGTSYDVLIDGTGADTVTYDLKTGLVNSLTLGPGETLQNNRSAQSLSIGRPASPSSGMLTNLGTINWTNHSNLTISSGLGMGSNSTTSVHNGTVTVNGDVTTDFASRLSLENGSTGRITGNIQTATGGFVAVASRSTLSVTGGVDLSFNGTLSVDGSTLKAGGAITGSNEASVSITNGSSVSAAAVGLQSEGVIVVSDSNLNIAGSLSNSDLAGISIQHSIVNAGTISNTSDLTVLIISGGSVVTVQHDFSNGNSSGNPNFSLDAGSSVLVGGAYINGDTQNAFIGGTLQTNSFAQSGGSTTISGLLSATNSKVTGGSITVDGTLDPTAVEIGSRAALDGTGKIIGNIAMAGTITPGASDVSIPAPGTLTIFGNYEQIGSGTLDEMMSATSQSFLHVTGDVALDSDSLLQITLLGGFDPLGRTFSIMDYSSLVGQFSNGSSFLDDGYLWDIMYDQNEIDVTAVGTVVGTPEPSCFLLLGLGLVVLAGYAARKTANCLRTERGCRNC